MIIIIMRRGRKKIIMISRCGCAAALAAGKLGVCHGWGKGRERNINQERRISFFQAVKDAS